MFVFRAGFANIAFVERAFLTHSTARQFFIYTSNHYLQMTIDKISQALRSPKDEEPAEVDGVLPDFLKRMRTASNEAKDAQQLQARCHPLASRSSCFDASVSRFVAPGVFARVHQGRAQARGRLRAARGAARARVRGERGARGPVVAQCVPSRQRGTRELCSSRSLSCSRLTHALAVPDDRLAASTAEAARDATRRADTRARLGNLEAALAVLARMR